MQIELNGQKMQLASSITLLKFLQTQGIDPKAGIALAVNEKIVKRNDWQNIWIQESDQIELIQAVQGG